MVICGSTKNMCESNEGDDIEAAQESMYVFAEEAAFINRS